jgi:hypothetical protein
MVTGESAEPAPADDSSDSDAIDGKEFDLVEDLVGLFWVGMLGGCCFRPTE